MHYSSTRGKVHGLSFEEAVMMGLADDGGLLVPDSLPDLSKEFPQWRGCSFQELCFNIVSRFVNDDIPDDDLKELIEKSYSGFRHDEVTPVVKVGNRYILELFHGPTFAFKDVALQFLGNLFEYFLEKRGHTLQVLGATSGDTGSAAIYGVRGKANIDIFMLHPHGKVSPVQEQQMITVLDDNVHNFAIEGTFDDAQSIVKNLFNDDELKDKLHMGAVNSINWARIVVQIVYYFYAYFQVSEDDTTPVTFAVPSGNFGNSLAGNYARKMGLPIDRIIVSTNKNDILYRFFTQGKYDLETVCHTLTPSMDIQVSSNFERFLYHLCGESTEQLTSWMDAFSETGKLQVSQELLDNAQQWFSAGRVTEEETLETIRTVYEEDGYLLDPHSAIGVCAATKENPQTPVICLACAHPAKFSDAIEQAIGEAPPLPKELNDLQFLDTAYQLMSSETESVRKAMLKVLARLRDINV